MDSHSFRIIADELAALLRGARVEKIHEPRPGVYVFLLFAAGEKRKLLMRCERQFPQLFVTGLSLSNPSSPSAGVMRLRKYCQGRRLGEAATDFASRCMAFALPTASGAAPVFLLLDMVAGPSVTTALPAGFGSFPPWPDASVTDALCGGARRKEEAGLDAPWRAFTVLTPLLRETLAFLEPMEGRALLVDLEAGGGGLFLYADADENPVCYSAWPLPEEICARKGFRVCPVRAEPETTTGGAGAVVPGFPALSAAALVDEPFFLQRLGTALHKEQALPERKKVKKLSRLMAKLDQEEQRLQGMLAMREDARALQAVLWRYAPEEKTAVVRVPRCGEGEEREGERDLSLDPRFTVRENMERMFKQSDRGARGLAMLAQRRAEYAAAESDGGVKPAARHPGPAAKGEGVHARPPAAGEKYEKDVARFQSSDGFVLLRGKNARGNQRLLKLGSGHDLWLHAEGGPSAHLIIRRAHAAEEVPERTLLEAAALVAEKSWQRHDDKAGVMVALLRHVHAVKGAPPGAVRVEKIARSLVVRPGPGEEKTEGREEA